ncbi:hypothetical protein ACFWN7_10375 [Agromyces sp. NPDC058484]
MPALAPVHVLAPVVVLAPPPDHARGDGRFAPAVAAPFSLPA